MNKETSIKLFEQNQIRSVWNDDEEKWYFSIVDVIGVLTGTDRPRKYWSDLKTKLKNEGSELSEKIGQLKLKSTDGKYYKTDVIDTEQLFRLIQSVPSPKAEPFKMWLAKVGRERIDEIEDPEIGIDRLMETYQRKAYIKKTKVLMKNDLQLVWFKLGGDCACGGECLNKRIF
jgi:hypothetical protein